MANSSLNKIYFHNSVYKLKVNVNYVYVLPSKFATIRNAFASWLKKKDKRDEYGICVPLCAIMQNERGREIGL